ncbi:TIGR01244 family sulfur transferase [Oricola thermophila]|uniref:TIGR01244 family phosphatase n=1 Tax=Oricola thermophila TaxID=2742145 RepID=A0A6N1VET1_9HYPH|nr:TIGR01244 family sulfur transferase [Oricola thermophila]QKV19198.1 TIGR01244 family phosphatase [Oricola thermophila]
MSADTARLPAALRQVANGIFVSGQVLPEHVAALAEAGYTTIICNRPDHEAPGQPTAAEIEAEAGKQGIAFYFVPVGQAGITRDMVDTMQKALSEADGLVLAYCRSGARSAHMCTFARP